MRNRQVAGSRRSGSCRSYPTLTPNSVPTNAVAPMASAPQKVTLSAPRATPAPPAVAPSPPRTASNTYLAAATNAEICAGGASVATFSGTTAPTAKVMADHDGRLNRVCRGGIGNPKLVAGMAAQRVACGQLRRDGPGQIPVEASFLADPRQFITLGLWRLGQLLAFARQIGAFRVCLRTDRDIFARRH